MQWYDDDEIWDETYFKCFKQKNNELKAQRNSPFLSPFFMFTKLVTDLDNMWDKFNQIKEMLPTGPMLLLQEETLKDDELIGSY